MVTFKRVLVIVICIWTLNIGILASAFSNMQILRYYSSILVPLCLVVSSCCYTTIYVKLLHHQAQVQEHFHQGQPNGHAPLNICIARYRRTVSSVLWVQFTVLTCYLPAGTVKASVTIKGITPTLCIAWTFLVTVVHLNSTLNPILYCSFLLPHVFPVRSLVHSPCVPFYLYPGPNRNIINNLYPQPRYPALSNVPLWPTPNLD